MQTLSQLSHSLEVSPQLSGRSAPFYATPINAADLALFHGRFRVDRGEGRRARLENDKGPLHLRTKHFSRKATDQAPLSNGDDHEWLELLRTRLTVQMIGADHADISSGSR